PVGSPGRADGLARAAALAPWDGRYPNFLGVSLLTQAGREPSVERARALLRSGAEAQRKAIAIEPENSYYYSNLGRVAAVQAGLRPPEASISDVRSIFGEALARDPVNAEIMDHAAQSLIQLGQPGEARGIAIRTATLYPDLAQPLGLLGYTALLEQRWVDAADTLALAVKRQWFEEKEPQAAAWSNLSAAYLSLNRSEEARRAAEEALALDPADKDAAGNRDLALQQLGRAAGGKR
ncbi:MAG TPA: tetratricopeptide repeat protein, partial [Candidatus Saccharimonadales bacterium]|nr:tetratricopeptide repeat protein [Candidatus Saccharimonadales bacterium]